MTEPREPRDFPARAPGETTRSAEQKSSRRFGPFAPGGFLALAWLLGLAVVLVLALVWAID